MKSDLFISLTVLLPIINETESLIKTINTIEAENPNKIKQYLLICHPSKTKVDSIKSDYNSLKGFGIQPRYNTSIPQIIFNIYKYFYSFNT